jgi:7,8-dihydropterin-6-yl-methyl-4-(beta-D-ribofuranosyl)aminobenzene 5'-phosphate synthase
MKTFKILSVNLLFLLLTVQLSCQDYNYLESGKGLSVITSGSGIDKPVTVRVVYDNYLKEEGLKTDWGFSIVIEGLEKGILFDTGTNPDIFASNFSKMGLDANKIDIIVLSHEHLDHVGGLPAFVKLKTGIPVLFPESFSASFKKRMIDIGLHPLLVKDPGMICNHLYTSGEFKHQIPEQSLVLDTKNGLVVMTGCSHPGIVEMLKKIKSVFGKDIYLVFGGFHLMQKTDAEMSQIISEFKTIGVVKCGATHCTGDKQIQMIREAFGSNFVEMGVGNSIVIN